MLSVSPSMIVRSSMEEMLDSLRRRDDDEKPKDLPPALPSRPTSKARRRSAKRPLPDKFVCVKKEEIKHTRGGSLGGKKLKEGEADESPYVFSSEQGMEFQQRLEENGSANLPLDLNDDFGLLIKKNDTLEEARKQVLLGTLEVQKCFRSHQARRYFHELKRGVISLQSFVRAANARRKYNYLINQKEQVVQKTLDEQQRAVLQLQAVIRGWLARKQVNILQNLKSLNQDNSCSCHSPSRRISEEKEMPQVSKQVLPLVVEELQKRVLKAEITLEKKEQENAALRDQLQQYEVRRLENEGKMKSMEDMWQKQTTSLQIRLAAVKRSLAENTPVQPGSQEGSPSPHYYDSDDKIFMETQTPGSTPIKLANSVTEFGAGRQSNGNGNGVCHVMKEFDQRKHTFDDGVKAIIEVKSRHSASANPDKELRNLKNKFETWMKDYKARLREAKAKLRKLGLSDAEKRHRKWWGGISKRQ